MNKIVNTLLLAGDKFMPEMHSKQHGVTYCACGSFTKNKKSIKKFIQTGNTDYIYRNDLDKAFFQHDMAYHKSKDLAKRNKVLRNKSFQIISDPKCHRYQIGLAAMVYQYFDKKKPSWIGVATKSVPNYQLANELPKQIIRIFKRRKLGN